jgi:hypothetical protein
MIRAVFGDYLDWIRLERAMVKGMKGSSWDNTLDNFGKHAKVGTYVVLGEEA